MLVYVNIWNFTVSVLYGGSFCIVLNPFNVIVITLLVHRHHLTLMSSLYSYVITVYSSDREMHVHFLILPGREMYAKFRGSVNTSRKSFQMEW